MIPLRGLAVPIVLASLALLPACACREDAAVERGAADRAELCGTVLDAATGAPVARARLRFPDGREARADSDGRFRLRDLEPGLTGLLEAEAPDGRRGSNTLRPLRPEPLEVVIYVHR
jgi:hypothetical protein